MWGHCLQWWKPRPTKKPKTKAGKHDKKNNSCSSRDPLPRNPMKRVIFSITFIFFKAVNFFTLVNCGGSVSFPTCLMLEWHTWRRFHVKPILNDEAEQPCLYNPLTPHKKTTKYLKKTAYLAHCLQPPAQHDAWFDLVCVQSRTTGRQTSKPMTRNLRNVFFYFIVPLMPNPPRTYFDTVMYTFGGALILHLNKQVTSRAANLPQCSHMILLLGERGGQG